MGLEDFESAVENLEIDLKLCMNICTEEEARQIAIWRWEKVRQEEITCAGRLVGLRARFRQGQHRTHSAQTQQQSQGARDENQPR